MGYYDPKTKVLYLVNEAPKSGQHYSDARVGHALQDQYISLDSTQKSRAKRSAVGCAGGFEGSGVRADCRDDAGTDGDEYARWMDRIREMIRENQSSMPVFSRAPTVIQETLIFPYLSGAEFVRNFKDRNAGKSLYDDMPVSTEQVLHPRAFFGSPRDVPTSVTLPALAGVSKTYENTLGEFETRLFLYEHLRDQNEAVQGATGWDGDRYATFGTAEVRGYFG